MSRKFIVSSLSFCLSLHTGAMSSETSQLLVDKDNHTIRFGRDYGHGLFVAVVEALIQTCDMSTAILPAKPALEEYTYWYYENWVDNTHSYLSVFRDRNDGNSETLEQTLNCSSTVAHELLYRTRPPSNLFDSFNWIIYLAAIPAAVFVGAVIYKINGGFTQTQASPV